MYARLCVSPFPANLTSLGELSMTTSFSHLARLALVQELQELGDAVRQLAQPLTDQELWTKPINPGNSIGHLILHLTGNLSHYVGAQLGKTGYVRDREREFSET